MNFKHNQKGFSPVIVLVITVVLIVIGAAIYSVSTHSKSNDDYPGKPHDSTNQTTQKQSSNPSENKPLRLYNLGLVSLDSVLIDQNAVREFDSKGLKGFYVFGDSLGKNDPRKNPNFEFSSLKTDTKVVSSIDGIVTSIKVQPESNDSEVFIQPTENSPWIIGYDHITNISVKKGDSVKTGDVIGVPSKQGNGSLRFEIQVNQELGGQTTHYCPSSLLDESVSEKLLSDLTSMQNAWEASTKLELYDASKQSPVGCIFQTLTPQQAEGR